MEYKEKNLLLAETIFPDIKETLEDLEKKYPKRNLKEGAIVCRIAPSPTGFLHTGSLCTALVNKFMAYETDGVFFLRVEDTDQKREVAGSVEALTKELNLFGVIPDEGVIAENKEIGDYGPYTQSNRETIYKIVAKEAIKRGIAYPCFCSQEDLDKIRSIQEEKKIVPGYYGQFARCRNIEPDEAIKRIKNGEKYILRFRSNGSHLRKITYKDIIRGKIEIAQNDMDIVIIKSDGLPTYHFAHLVDDHFMRTTHVIRGEEWISSVPLHIDLFNSLEFDVPKYGHVPTIMKNDGESRRKLSKRKDSEAAVSYFLENGYPTESVIEYLLGIINSDFEMWRKQNPTTDIYKFNVRLEKMGVAGALFDMIKLNDVSKQVISRMDSKEILKRVLDYSKTYDIQLYELLNSNLEYAKKIFAIERDNVTKVRKDICKWSDINYEYNYFFDDRFKKDIEENGYAFSEKIGKDKIIEVLESYIKIHDDKITKEQWFENSKEIAKKIGFCTDMKEYKANPDNYVGSISDFMEIIRIAITNRKNSPDIYSIMQVLENTTVIARLKNVIEKI